MWPTPVGESRKFLILTTTYHGSGGSSHVFTVRDGAGVEVALPENASDSFSWKGGDSFSATEHAFVSGQGHLFIEHDLVFNESSFRFMESGSAGDSSQSPFLYEIEVDLMHREEGDFKTVGNPFNGSWHINHFFVTDKEEVYPGAYRLYGYIITSDDNVIDAVLDPAEPIMVPHLSWNGITCYTHSPEYVEAAGLDYHWYWLDENGNERPIH